MITDIIKTPTLVLLILILSFNMTQRRHSRTGTKKRMATLLVAVSLAIPYGGILWIQNNHKPDLWLAAFFAAGVLTFIAMRKQIFIFNRRCPSCGAPFGWKELLYVDQPICPLCTEKEEKLRPVSSEKQKIEYIPGTVDQIDWESWIPTEEAVLCFIREGDQILLIHKKTGLGKGKINGPGGRIEKGETPKEAAVRECQEEVHMTPKDLTFAGTLQFQFTNGYRLKGHVFITDKFDGTPAPSEEADPFWCSVNELPFDNMWADDILWLPRALKGELFDGRFIFHDDEMVSHEIVFLS